MKAPYFVEILTRGGEIRHRYQLDSLPINIGRGYDNDIILDDPHTAVHHAIVEQDADGNLTVRDQMSHNGILFNGKHKTEEQIDGNSTFQLGHTILRIRYSDFQVDKEIPVSSFHRWEGWPAALTGIALVVLLACESTWIDDTERFEVSSYFGFTAVLLSIGIVWCGIWAFANRLFGEHAHIGRHIFIFGCGLVAMEILGQAIGLIAYSFSLDALTRYGSHTLIAMLSVIIFFHLQQIKSNRTRQVALACVTLSFLGSAAMLLYNYNTRKMLADDLFMHTRFPPGLRVVQDKPVTKLLDDTRYLKTKVDKERVKAASEDETDAKGED